MLTHIRRTRVFAAVLAVMLFWCPAHAFSEDVTASWDPNGEPDLSGYRIYYGASSGSHSAVIDVGDASTHTLTHLEPGKTYYFAATAYDTSGNESAFSAEVSFQMPGDGSDAADDGQGSGGDDPGPDGSSDVPLGDGGSPLGDAIDDISSRAGCFVAAAAQQPLEAPSLGPWFDIYGRDLIIPFLLLIAVTLSRRAIYSIARKPITRKSRIGCIVLIIAMGSTVAAGSDLEQMGARAAYSPVGSNDANVSKAVDTTPPKAPTGLRIALGSEVGDDLNTVGAGDSDGDGVQDASDGCPSDPNKLAEGECGCGIPEGTCGSECADLPGYRDAQGYACSEDTRLS